MGQGTSCIPATNPTVDQNGLRIKPIREKDKYGICTVKIMSITAVAGARRNQERISAHTITPKGAIIHGTQCNPQAIQRALASSGFPFLTPAEIQLNDSRAHKLLVLYNDGWFAIPSPEPFSRHTGTCIVLGDRTSTSPPYSIKLGDCFRLGSVGLVVSEMRTLNGEEQRLDQKILQYLKDETLTVDNTDDVAALAADENDGNEGRPSGQGSSPDMKGDMSVRTDVGWNEEHGGVGCGERFICYMCYETHDTPEDPLVAPCECKGDTRYLHVQCLQRWYQSSVLGPQSQVIRTTGNGAPACKICGSAYKTAFRKADGRKANLLEIEGTRPYISLVVVTRHDTNPGLFNTKFRLNFGRTDTSFMPDISDGDNHLLIGRSSSCNMVLDYRTVSTIHAQISYSDGAFYMVDKRSSNGTMVYLQEPLPLPYNQPVRLRMGRTTLTVQTKRSMTALMREMFSRPSTGASNHRSSGFMAPADLQALLVGSGSLLPQLQPAPVNGSIGGLGPSMTPMVHGVAHREGSDRGSMSYSALEGAPVLSEGLNADLVRNSYLGRMYADSNALSNRVREIESGMHASEEELVMLAMLLSSELEAKEKERQVRESAGGPTIENRPENMVPEDSLKPNMLFMKTVASASQLIKDDDTKSDARPNSAKLSTEDKHADAAVHASPSNKGAALSGRANVAPSTSSSRGNSGFNNINGFEYESPAFLDVNGNYTYAAVVPAGVASLEQSIGSSANERESPAVLNPPVEAEQQAVVPANQEKVVASSSRDNLNIVLAVPATELLMASRSTKNSGNDVVAGATAVAGNAEKSEKFTVPRQLSGNGLSSHGPTSSSRGNSRPSSGGMPGAGSSAGASDAVTAAAGALSTSVLANAVQILSRDSLETMADEDANVRIRVRKVSAHNPRVSQPTTPPPQSAEDPDVTVPLGWDSASPFESNPTNAEVSLTADSGV